MKKKKCLFLIFLSVVLVFNSGIGYAIGNSGKDTLTKEEILSLTEEEIDEKVNKEIEAIENRLESMGTNVIEGLELGKSKMKELLKNEKDPVHIDNINNQIKNYDMLIEMYKSYKNGNLNNFNVNSSVELQSVFHPLLSPAVAAAISFFNSNGFFLAGELLNHSLDAKRGSVYEPRFKNQTKGTDEFSRLRKEIFKSGKEYGHGSSEFPNVSGKANKDLYYAIHGYNYNYKRSLLVIKDLYDYDMGNSERYGDIEGLAVDTMYMAQTLGVINPYSVIMELDL